MGNVILRERSGSRTKRLVRVGKRLFVTPFFRLDSA